MVGAMTRFRIVLIVLGLLALAVPAASTSADRMLVGFQDDPSFRWLDSRDANLTDAAQTGASIVRTTVYWDRIAPTRPAVATDPFDPAYRFDDLDDLVRSATLRGMTVMMSVWSTPGWANGGKGPNYAPTRLSDFQGFMKALAARYSGRYPGLSVRRLLLGLERAEPAAVPGADLRQPREAEVTARSTQGSPRGLRRCQGRELACARRHRRDVPAWPVEADDAARRPADAGTRPVRPGALDRPPDRQVRRLGAPPVLGHRRLADAEGALPERRTSCRSRRSTDDLNKWFKRRTRRSGSPSTGSRRSPASRRASRRRSRPPT